MTASEGGIVSSYPYTDTCIARPPRDRFNDGLVTGYLEKKRLRHRADTSHHSHPYSSHCV